MELELSSINRTCRTCRSETLEMRSLFDGYEMVNESPRIDEMLMACTAVQAKAEDGLPSSICIQCTDQLKIAYCFKQQCQQSDMYFKECLRNVKNANMKAEKNIKEEMQIAEAAFTDIFIEATVAADTKLSNPTQRSDYIEFMESNQMILTCRECGKVFTTLDGLRSHKRIHLGTLFKCRFCGKGYTRQTHVYRHELSHGKHKIHVCRICNKSLTRMEHLRRHLTTHLKEKPFHCKSCNRGFNRTDHLDAHALRCKGDRVHICDICNRGFSRFDSMEVHKKMHENQKPILPTLDNIDNIEEHYYEIDFDPNMDDSVTICSTGSDVEDLLEPQVEVNENIEGENDEGLKGIGVSNREEKIFEESLVNDNSMENIDNSESLENNENTEPNNLTNESGLNDRSSTSSTMNETVEPVEGTFDVFQEAPEGTNDVADNDSDSVHSEYLPTKTKKRGRGRPRKFPKPARPRGRPKKTDIKRETDEEDEYACNFCSETFKKMSHLDKHIRRIHDSVKEYNCSYCIKTFSRYNHYKRHLASHQTVKAFTCDTCGKGFVRRDHLRQHVKLHEKKLEYECDECGKKFNRADQLAKHKVSKHGSPDVNFGEKKFECEVCRKTFTTEKYRDVHYKGHLGEKRHQCRTCQKCFLSKSHLTEHMKFHNDHSKKFLCSECGQRFIRNDYLVIHMRRHRGEKPFKCKFCGKGFPRTTDLTVHERYHTGEKTHLCTICGRGFGRAYNLTVHMRTHTGEKPYRCTYCDAAFAQGNDLKAHVRRHTGERFQCELCSENFLMGYLLTQHKRTVHGLNVVSNIRRLQPLDKIKQDLDESPPITIPLPKPIIPDAVFSNISAHLAAQIQNHHLGPLTHHQ